MIYNEAYHEEYVRRSRSDLGRRIYRARWAFIRRYCMQGTVLDYGCGAGGFHAGAPEQFPACGYDINPFSPFYRPPGGDFDILTMWDVIEHLIEPTAPLEDFQPRWVFISTPNVEAATDVLTWKHYKPGEHLHYFSRKSLEAVLGCAGYRIKGWDGKEGQLRDPNNPNAIISCVAKRTGLSR